MKWFALVLTFLALSLSTVHAEARGYKGYKPYKGNSGYKSYSGYKGHSGYKGRSAVGGYVKRNGTYVSPYTRRK